MVAGGPDDALVAGGQHAAVATIAAVAAPDPEHAMAAHAGPAAAADGMGKDAGGILSLSGNGAAVVNLDGDRTGTCSGAAVAAAPERPGGTASTTTAADHHGRDAIRIGAMRGDRTRVGNGNPAGRPPFAAIVPVEPAALPAVRAVPADARGKNARRARPAGRERRAVDHRHMAGIASVGRPDVYQGNGQAVGVHLMPGPRRAADRARQDARHPGTLGRDDAVRRSHADVARGTALA
ncbi:hypothetical protein D9M72_261120 [compost metagenome]